MCLTNQRARHTSLARVHVHCRQIRRRENTGATQTVEEQEEEHGRILQDPAGLEALGEHLVFGQRRVDHGRAGTVVSVVAELVLQPLHLVVVEILLDQVALSLYPSPHVRGNVGNHPGHEELHQEHDVLKGRRPALTRRRGLEEDYVKASEMNHRAAEGSLVFTSMMMMKASLAARMCQNCMVWVYCFSCPGG